MELSKNNPRWKTFIDEWEKEDRLMAELFEAMAIRENWVIDIEDGHENEMVLDLVRRICELASKNGVQTSLKEEVHDDDIADLVNLFVMLSAPVSLRLMQSLFATSPEAYAQLIEWVAIYADGGEPEAANLYARLELLESFGFLAKVFEKENIELVNQILVGMEEEFDDEE